MVIEQMTKYFEDKAVASGNTLFRMNLLITFFSNFQLARLRVSAANYSNQL